jgi:general secretion pathway protein G
LINCDIRSDAGFTLIELLVVLAILSMLAMLVMPYVTNILPKARADAARIQIERLGSILDLYDLDMGRYPTSEEGLNVLITPPSDASNWRGPYVKNAGSLSDPWGRLYQYRSPGVHGEYDLFSFGADGKEGGEGANADIANQILPSQ